MLVGHTPLALVADPFIIRITWLADAVVVLVADGDEMGQDGVWRDACGILELGFLAHAIHRLG